jgi:hypothetical protein
MDTQTAALITGLGAILGVIWAWMNIRERFRDSDRKTEARFKDLEIKTGMVFEIFFEDAKAALRQRGLVRAQSPDRLSPGVARHLIQNGLGARLLAFYHDLIAKHPETTEADGTWQLYIAFKPDLGPHLMEPLGMNVSEALVAAWQFCVDGGADG